MEQASPNYSFIVRLKLDNRPGTLARALTAIGEQGGTLGAIDLVSGAKSYKVRDLDIESRDESHGSIIVEALRKLEGVEVVNVSDSTFLLHLGGKIEVHPKIAIRTRDDLSRVYTPGVARVSLAIAKEKSKAYNLTIKKNTVAVVTDGTAVLGLGDIGPEAAMPVMEGKAMLFKEFGGVDAWPIALDTRDPDKIIEVVVAIAPGFGGINLEDISAPRCFAIEEALRKRLDIPVFHDDQHGTAIVVLAGVINALRIVNKSLDQIKIVVNGAGAAGISVSRILLGAGAKELILCDRKGAIYLGRQEDMNPYKEAVSRISNPQKERGPLRDVLRGAGLFIGLSGPGLLSREDIHQMASDPIVFAMANPEPEISMEEALPHARIYASGRSDYPNQINNVLAFPGIFRGALDVRASTINAEMELAAAYALASVIPREELSEEYIIPSVFNREVVKKVSEAVAEAARKSGVARKEMRSF